jgi:hypothetical protein
LHVDITLIATVGLGAPFIVLAILLAGICAMGWHYGRAQTLLDRWAVRCGVKLVAAEYRWIARGPFWWRASRGQAVFRVEVIDGFGQYHRGWVRCGSWYLGLLSDTADAVWDVPKAPTGPRGFPVIVKPPPDHGGGH